MRRLIYAPKAYIFIRSSNQDGCVYDVSSDVTSGSITQNLGDLSTAKFTLRNRYRKWIRDKDSGLQIFLPMDMVTIWLQRVAGRPIQVFTGYLNEVPYYQAYPGDAIFSASCTLKKLAFTWFDPGLPFFIQWVDSNDGWTITPDGEAYNPIYLSTAEALGPNKSLSNLDQTTATVNDTGFDALIGRFLTEVAGWSNDDVLISNLPKDLPKLAARLYSDINNQTESDLATLEAALGQTMGISGWSNPDPSTPTTSNNSPAQVASIMQVISQIKAEVDNGNVPLLVCGFAAYVNTTFDPNHDDSQNNQYGLYAMTSNGTTVAGPGTSSGSPTIDGVAIGDIIGDASAATRIFWQRANQPQNAALLKAVRASLTLANVQALAESVLGYKFSSSVDLQSAFSQVKQYLGAAISTPGGTSATSSVDPGSLTWSDPRVTKLLTPAEAKVVAKYYSSSKPWLSGLLYRAKQISPTITIVAPIGTKSATSVTLYGPANALSNFFATLTGDDSVDSVDAIINGFEYTLKMGSTSSIDAKLVTKNNNTMVLVQSQSPDTTSTPTNSTPASSNTDLGGALGTLSANAAFAAQFAFPANQIESISLTGDRALMNDVSCLDGVKQFCQASLRTFRSLPDGRFLAFYPDYFGASRQPYWQIYNIEITNFGIQLNDDALATHVYVVGDTFDGDGQITWQDQVSTRGVATITQAFMLNSFIEDYAPTDPNTPLVTPTLGRLQDAYSFLQQYGARPYEEDQPLIRNVFYEFLLAWQRFMQKWSAQFATTCTFTFQPEVMAGGLIAFPDHGVQMFCESVTHTWDYTNGFQTDATLTAPALLTGKQTDPQTKPGFALAGNINSVGA